jgi:hypothetical protein
MSSSSCSYFCTGLQHRLQMDKREQAPKSLVAKCYVGECCSQNPSPLWGSSPSLLYAKGQGSDKREREREREKGRRDPTFPPSYVWSPLIL